MSAAITQGENCKKRPLVSAIQLSKRDRKQGNLGTESGSTFRAL